MVLILLEKKLIKNVVIVILTKKAYIGGRWVFFVARTTTPTVTGRTKNHVSVSKLDVLKSIYMH